MIALSIPGEGGNSQRMSSDAPSGGEGAVGGAPQLSPAGRPVNLTTSRSRAPQQATLNQVPSGYIFENGQKYKEAL